MSDHFDIARAALAFVLGFLAMVLLSQLAHAQDCDRESGALVQKALSAKKPPQTLTIEGEANVKVWLGALKQASHGQIDLPAGPRLLFMRLKPKEGWLMIGYAATANGKECVLGAMGLSYEMLSQIIKTIGNGWI